MRFLAAILILGLQDARLPPPEAAALKTAEKLIRDVFKDDYSRKDPASRRTLAAKLLKQAGETADDPTARFVLFTEARDIAADAGDVKTALAAALQQAKIYAVDPIATKRLALDRARKTAGPEDLQAAAEAYLQLSEEAVASEDFDGAQAALKEAEQAALKAKNLPLVARIRTKTKDAAAMKSDAVRLAEARKKLETAPEDPGANLVLGRHLCFTRGEWTKGLPLLAAGADNALKALAQKDLANPGEAAEQVALGDQWWDLAEKEEGSAASFIGGRAWMWYDRAQPQVTGLLRAKIEKRLDALKQKGARLESGAQIPIKGLIGWWKLDDGSGEEAVESVSGAANGRLVKGPAWVSGRIGGGLSFDGVDDFVSIPETAGKGVAESFTMTLWANPKATRRTTAEGAAGSVGGGGQRYAIFPSNAGFQWPTGHSYAGISVGTNGISVIEHGPGYLPALLVQDMEIKDWIHVAVVYTGNQPKLYVDGKPTKTGVKSAKTVHPGTSLGEGGVGYGYYSGMLDDVRLYNRPLTDAEVRSLASGK